MTELEWWEFESPTEMAEQVAGDITFIIDSAVEAHGSARLALPGGATPELIYKSLVKKRIDWKKVTLVPTDDRLVKLDDPLSNYRQLDALFSGLGATVVSLVDEASLNDYREAGRLADARLAMLEWPLDLVCLGMGEDGHTASIMPGPDLDRAISGPRERRAVGVRPDPMPSEAAVDRVTLTSSAIAAARAVMVVIRGEAKKTILEEAVAEGPLSAKPIGRVLAELDAPVDTFWSAD